MAGWHEVVQGENLSAIAYRYGFRNFRAVYHHAENSDFRRKRSNPNIIFPGDRIYIPDRKEKVVDKPTDQKHHFVMQSPRKVLRMALQDFNGTPLSNALYELQIGPELLQGETDYRGVLERRIPLEAREAKLKVKQYQWTLRIGDLNPVDETPDMGVSGIQMRLRNLGFDPGPIDGIAGPITAAAIRGFQKKHPPLATDGICGPKTTERLLQEHGC